jgi:dolichyl-phosphate beta-glucosyltransferase
VLSLIIPVYNNSETLQQQLPLLQEFLTKQSFPHEIILVDDGSVDHQKVTTVSQNLKCRLVVHKTNLGKGAAIRSGMLQAKGTYCLFTDADIPFIFDDLVKLYENLNSGLYDMVVGDRSLNASNYYSHVAIERRIASKFFSLLVGYAGLKGFPDTQCGIKGFTITAVNTLFKESIINGFAFDVEILSLAQLHNLRILRQPITLRNSSSSSVHLFYHSLEMARDVMRIRMQLKRLKNNLK